MILPPNLDVSGIQATITVNAGQALAIVDALKLLDRMVQDESEPSLKPYREQAYMILRRAERGEMF